MADAVLVTIGLIFLVVLLVYKYLTWHFDIWKKIGLAGPRPKLLYGNFPSVITEKQHIVYDLDAVYNEYKKSHRAIGVFLTRNPEIMILDPKLGHEVMVTNFRKYRDNLSSKWISNRSADKYAARNPFFVPGDEWKNRRAEVLQGLTTNKFNQAYPIWKGSAQKLRRFLETATKKDAIIETKDIAYRFTGDIIGDFCWGLNAGTFEQALEANPIRQNSAKMIQQILDGVGHYYALSIAPFLRSFFRTRIFSEESDNFFSQLTKDAMAIRSKDGNTDRADFLNHVMQLQEKKGISHDDAVGHILTVLLDGYETSAVVLYHTIFYLAKHSEIQEKLRSEILGHVEADGFVNFDTLNSLPYLDQCVHETLRLITPIPFTSRICTEPTEIELGADRKIFIKVGTIVTIPIFSYHHDPDYFPQPFEYNPERFDNGVHPEFTKRGIFLPFGDGPRICAGMRMSLFEVKTALVEILKNYQVKPCAKTIDEKKPDGKKFILGLDGEFWLEYRHL